MPIFIPDLFSSYVEGRRKAIQDNWNDLNNYNNVLGGQLDNAYTMDTFDARARQESNNAQVSDMNTALSGANTDLALSEALEGLRQGLPVETVRSKLQQAIAAQKEALFQGKVYSDPNYYKNYVNPSAQTGAGAATIPTSTTGIGTGIGAMQGTGKEPTMNSGVQLPQTPQIPSTTVNAQTPQYVPAPDDLSRMFPGMQWTQPQLDFLHAAIRTLASQRAAVGQPITVTRDDLERYMATNPSLFPNYK